MNPFSSYVLDGFYDELYASAGKPRPAAEALLSAAQNLGIDELLRRQRLAEAALLRKGITFNVYGHADAQEKIFPFDVLPRVIELKEWERLEAGLKQRLRALNLFLQDLYHDRKILKDRIIPQDLVLSSRGFLTQCQGLTPQREVWCHIAGTDLVRDKDGTVYVLEDNLRCPSRRQLRAGKPPGDEADLPRVLRPRRRWRRWMTTPATCWRPCSRSARPAGPAWSLLTPGAYNCAYYEHSFLAQQMGIELVEGATSSSRTAGSSCARPAAPSRWT